MKMLQYFAILVFVVIGVTACGTNNQADLDNCYVIQYNNTYYSIITPGKDGTKKEKEYIKEHKLVYPITEDMAGKKLYYHQEKEDPSLFYTIYEIKGREEEETKIMKDYSGAYMYIKP